MFDAFGGVRRGLAEQLAGGQAKHGNAVEAADPAGRTWFGGDADLQDFTAGVAQALENHVERIGARGARAQD